MRLTVRERASLGFTLIEVLAVILLTSLVLGMALDFYVDLSNRGNQATAVTRTWRRSLAVVDRVSSALQRAFLLVKPTERDWLSHPWVFLGERGHSESGADRIKFSTRRAPQHGTKGPTQDLGYVAYVLLPAVDHEGYELLRWSRPGLPEGLDRDLPNPQDMQVVAEEIADFGVQFLDESGQWWDEWDSSQLRHSNELPSAAKIHLTFLDSETSKAPSIERRINLPMVPIDLEALVERDDALAGGGEEEEDAEGLSVADCILDFDALPEELQAVIENSLDEPIKPFLSTIEEFGSAAEQHLDPECL